MFGQEWINLRKDKMKLNKAVAGDVNIHVTTLPFPYQGPVIRIPNPIRDTTNHRDWSEFNLIARYLLNWHITANLPSMSPNKNPVLLAITLRVS